MSAQPEMTIGGVVESAGTVIVDDGSTARLPLTTIIEEGDWTKSVEEEVILTGPCT